MCDDKTIIERILEAAFYIIFVSLLVFECIGALRVIMIGW